MNFFLCFFAGAESVEALQQEASTEEDIEEDNNLEEEDDEPMEEGQFVEK